MSMKTTIKYLTLFFALITINVINVSAQCNVGTLAGTITPTINWQTVAVDGRDYQNFAATAGDRKSVV